jgi:methylase of polypeptide subunit release factors
MNAPNEYDILLCNLPYIPDNFKINDAATYEPKIAIFGGKDGLDIYRKLFDQLLKIHHRPLYILTESFPESHNRLSIIAKKSGYTLFKNDDFVQIFIDQQKVY